MQSLINLCVVLLFTSLYTSVSGDVQSIKLCAEYDCIGEHEIIRSNVRNLTKVSKLLKAGKKIVNYCTASPSLWTVYKDPNFEEDSGDEDSRNIFGGSQYTCKAGQPSSFRHVGNGETHKSGLSLYSEKNYQGFELYFVGDTLQLPSPLEVQSYGFTGMDRYELYDGVDLDGNSKCIDRRDTGDGVELPFTEGEIDSNSKGNDVFRKLNSMIRGCLHVDRHTNFLPPDPSRLSLKTRPSLTLFAEADGQGNRLYFEGEELKLPHVLNISSFAFVGSWQTFPRRDFDGNSTCINVFTKQEPFQVGSIKLGCGHEELNIEEDHEAPLTCGARPFGPTFLLLVLGILWNHLGH